MGHFYAAKKVKINLKLHKNDSFGREQHDLLENNFLNLHTVYILCSLKLTARIVGMHCWIMVQA